MGLFDDIGGAVTKYSNPANVLDTVNPLNAANLVGNALTGNNFNVDHFIANATDLLTVGLAKYSNGGLQVGSYLDFWRHGIDESVGELSGRNRARKAGFEAQDAVTAAVADKANADKDALRKKEINDIQASNQASSVRGSADTQQRNLLGTSTSVDPARDFLGL